MVDGASAQTQTDLSILQSTVIFCFVDSLARDDLFCVVQWCSTCQFDGDLLEVACYFEAAS